MAYAIHNHNKELKKIKDTEMSELEEKFYCSLPPEQWFYIVEYRGNWLKLDEQEIVYWMQNRQIRNKLFKLAMKGKNLITGE